MNKTLRVMEDIEINNYLNALKSKKLRDIKFANFNRSDIMKKQENKCAKCKKDLRNGYYKFIKNPKTGKREAICSDCLVHITERK